MVENKETISPRNPTQSLTRKVALLPTPMVEIVRTLVPDCNKLLPPDINTEQFRAALWLELTGRPALHDCSLDSVRLCIVQAAQDGMLPGRDCHFLPFGHKGQAVKRAVKVDNYHGLQRALERTGKVARSWSAAVHQHDTWEFDRFMDRPRHIEAMTQGKEPGAELFYYGAILFKDGACAFETLSLKELKAIEASSPAHESGPWREWPEMMKRKSALKRVCKYVPLTPDIQRLLDADDTRLQTDIPEARHAQNIADVFGDDAAAPDPGAPRVAPRPPQRPRAAATAPQAPQATQATDSRALTLRAQITAVLQAQGRTPDGIAHYWDVLETEYADLSPGLLTYELERLTQGTPIQDTETLQAQGQLVSEQERLWEQEARAEAQEQAKAQEQKTRP